MVTNELTHLFVTVSGETVPFPSLSIFPNASRTNPSLSPLNLGLVASSSACHGATPLASPPPPPARRGPPSVSRWVNKARISAIFNPALDEANAAFKSPKERNPSLFLVGEKRREGGTILGYKSGCVFVQSCDFCAVLGLATVWR